MGGEAPRRPFPPIRFSDLDDFHPDQLLERVSTFEALRTLLARISDPSTFTRLMDEMSQPEQSPGGGLLDAIVDESDPGPGAPKRFDRSGLGQYVREVVRPHLVHEGSQRQLEMRAGVERELNEAMRDLLHHPAFQRLESTWRSVFHLVVNALRIGNQVRVYLLDVSREGLEEDLSGNGPLADTALHRLISAGGEGTAPDGSPWSLFVTADPFNLAESEIGLLARLAELGALFGAPWIAGVRALGHERPGAASGSPLDETALQQRVAALAATPAPEFLAVAYPGFLLRLPYGEETEPCEAFRFEEFAGEPEARDYLWGDPAVLCALATAALAVPESGEPASAFLEVEDLPLHLWDSGGESVARPCSEVILDDAAVQRLTSGGLTPIQASKGQDRVRIVRLQSVTGSSLPIARP
jgi:predicted component of type VI protein secretion system